MFEEKMSGKELLNEYCNDLPHLQSSTLQFNSSQYVRKILNKSKKQRTVTITHMFVAPSKNKYIGILTYEKDGFCKRDGWLLSAVHIGLMNTPRGKCAVVFYEKSQQALKMTSHFFDRYRERMKDNCDWKTNSQLCMAKTFEDLVSMFIKRNGSIVLLETEATYNDKVHIFSHINDGIALIQWNKTKKLLQANTFITEDMLSEKQEVLVGYARQYIEMSDEEKAMYECPDFIYEDIVE